MTATQDLFIGMLAVVVGSVLIIGAALQSKTLMQLANSRRLIETLGRTRARWVIAGIGIASVVVGVLIASGWRVRW
jgi:hypothetical protein